MKIRLVKNNSYSGSRVANSGTEGTSFLARENNIGECPQLIIVLGTRNDDNNTELGSYKYSGWTEEDLTTYRPALAKLLTDLKDANIGSTILFVSNSANTDKKASVVEICTHLSVPYLQVDLTTQEVTGVHPSTDGYKQFGTCIAATIQCLRG